MKANNLIYKYKKKRKKKKIDRNIKYKNKSELLITII